MLHLVSQDVMDAFGEELHLLVRHGRKLPSRHLVRCLQARRLLDDPNFEIQLDDIIQRYCDQNSTLASTDLLVRVTP